MIGIALLLVSLFTYNSYRYRWLSYFIYLSFMIGVYGGFNVWTDKIIGMKSHDLALIYTAVISVYMLSNGCYKIPYVTFRKSYIYILGFLGCGCLFSMFYYHIPVNYVIQGARLYLLLLALPILASIEFSDFEIIFKWLFYITLVTSIIYCIQIVIGRPLLPYPYEPHFDKGTGLIRLYNYPPLHIFFLAYTFVNPIKFGRYINIVRFIFFATLICTQGRTLIFTGLLTVLLAMLFTGKSSKLLKTVFILGVMIMPFFNMLTDRLEGRDTSSDISTILSGSVGAIQEGDGGTFTYRIAWVLERSLYLIERPFAEQFFGMGLITESYPKIHSMYNFSLGIIDKDTGYVVQSGTPDIAYGNLIFKLGFGGTIIYMLFIISMIVYFYKHKDDNEYMTVAAASLTMLLVSSLSGRGLADPQNLAVYFLILSTSLTDINSKNITLIYG